MPGKDTRVVEMQFQNKDFEKNIATSQKSLNRFKKDLNFDDTSKGLEKFGKSMDSLKFDKFFDNIQRLTDKFTGIGDIGEFMISKIRHSLEEAANSAIRFSKSLTFDQVDAGKEKFEQLNKSIQTIKAATGKTEEEVQGVLKRLNDYTDMTSYSFSDMASNIGKFTSVGIPLEQAEKQMEGIANWAARSGAGIAEASRAMYNLSQAMGVGSLKLMDWKSIENAGMATKEFKQQLIEAGLAAGTLVAEAKKDANGVEQIVYKTAKNLGKQVEVNFQNMSQTLSKGWANTTAIGNALLGYYYEDLKFENEEGMKDLTDDQKKMFDEMFKQYGKIDDKSWKKLSDQGLGSDDLKQSLLDTAEAMGALTAEVNADGKKIYTTTDKTGKKIEFTLDTFEKGLGGGWLTRSIAKTVYSFDDLAKGSYDAAMKCLSFTDVLNAWKDMISTGWMASIQHIFGGLSDSIEVFTAMCDKAGEMLGNIFGVNGAINKILGLWDTKEHRDTLWGMIIGEYGEGEDKLYAGAYGLLDVIKDVGSIISGAFWDIMKDFAEPFYGEDKLEEWENDTEVRYQFLADQMQVFVEKIRYAILNIKEFFQEIPEGASKSRWETIKDIVGAVFRVVSIAAQTISGIFTFFGKIKKQLEPSIIAVSDLITSLAGGITGAEKDLRKSKGIQTFFSNFADALVPVTNFINKVVVGLAKLIKGFFEWGIEGGNFIKIWETIKSVFKGIINIFDKISGPILDFFKEIGPAIGDFFTKGLNKDTLKNFGKTLGKSLGNLINTLVNYIPGLWSKIKNFFSSIFNTAKDVLGAEEPGILNSIINFIKGVFGGVWEFLKNLGNRLSDENSLASLILRLLGTGIGFVADLLGKIRDSISGISLYDVVIMITGGFILFTAFSLIKSALNVIRGISEIVGGFGEILDAIAYRIRGVDSSEKFLRVSQGIALIALAVVVLGQMKWQEALQGVIAIGAIGGIVILLTKVMTKMLEKVKFSSTIKMAIALASLSAGLLIFSAGVFVLVRALKPLANTNWEGLAKMGVGLAGILYLFSLFSFVSKLAKVSFKSMAGLGILAIGIGILVDSLKPLAEVNWSQMAKMGVGLAAILLMFAGFSRIMGSIKDKGISQTAFLAIGIAILVQSLLPLVSMDWSQMAKMGVGLLAILVLLAGFSHIAGSLKGKGMFSTITLAAGIVILMEAIKPLADYNWEKLGKMGAGLLVVLFFLAEFTKISGSLKGKSMKSTIALALGIILLMEAIKPLAEYSWEKLGKMFAGLTLTLLELAEFTKLMVSIKDEGMSKIILLAAGIWILMETIKPLADINWEDLGKMFAGLGVVLFELAEFSKHMASVKDKGLGNTILLAAGIYILMEALKPLGEMDWEAIGKMGAGLTGILVILVAASKKMGQIKAKTSFGVLLFSVALYGLLYVLKPLANYKWEELGKLGVSLLAVILMLGVAAKAIKGIDWKSAVGSFAMMLGMAVMISVFGKTVDKVKDIKSTKLLAFAGSIVILSIAIRIVLSSINKLEAQSKGVEIGSKLAMIAAALVTVGLLMFELSLLIPRINSANIKKLLGFSIAVDLLMPSMIIAASAINKINNVRTGADVGKKLALIGMALISVGILMAELALFIPRINNSDTLKILGFSIAVDVLMPSLIIAAIAINKINDVRTGADVGKKFALTIAALISVGVLMAELALFIPRINNADILKVAGFSVAVDILMPSLIIAAMAINKIQVPKTGKETFGKFSLLIGALISVAVIMGELALLIPLIDSTDDWLESSAKLIGFAIAVEAVMPALITAAMAINKIKVTTVAKGSGKNKKEATSIKETCEKLLLFSGAIAAVGLLMFELALLLPIIDGMKDWAESSAKLIGFAVAVEAVMPALITVVIAMNKIRVPNIGGKQSKKGKNNGSNNKKFDQVYALISLVGTAVLAMGLIMAELAWIAPRIDSLDNWAESSAKLIGFAVAVEAVMPALISVAKAINTIKVPTLKTGGKKVDATKYYKGRKQRVKEHDVTSNDGNEQVLPFKQLLGFFAVIGIAVLAMGLIMAELAWIAPRIDSLDNWAESSGKLIGFSIAVEAVMPALIVVAKAINEIKIPTMMKGNGKNKKEETIKFKELTGYFGIIGIAVLAMAAIMSLLALWTPYIGKMDEGSIGKLWGFAIAFEIIMPALITVAKAINEIKIPTLSNGTGKDKKTATIKFKELTGYFAIIGIAVLAMGAIMAEFAVIIPLINKIDSWEGLAKLVVFAIAFELIVPALLNVVDAINKVKIPKIDKKPAKFKDLTGYYAVIGIAVLTMGAVMAELAALIPLINGIDSWEGLAKLVVFAFAIDLVMPALITVAEAISKIELPKNGKQLYKAKDLSGYFITIGLAVGAMAVVMAELAFLIPLINDIDSWEGLAKLVVFAFAINLVMPALITAAEAINSIELPMNGKKVLKAKDLSAKFALIGMAIGTVALLMGELALLIPAINGIEGIGGMVKLVVFTISINILMASLSTVVQAINDIKTPTSKEALKKKMLILAEVMGVVALLTAEMALFIYRINDADIIRLIGFAIAVRALMPALNSVVKAINNIQTPTSKEALTKKLWILGGSLITVAVIIAEMSLFIDQINSSDFEKLLGFAAAVYLVMPSLEKVVGMINDIEAPEEGKELGFKMAILGGAFIAVAAIIAELALLSNQINNSNFESMLGIAAAVYLILPALSKVIEAIGEIEAPEEGKEVGFKLAIMAGALIAVAAIIAELALLGGMISNADVLKIMGFALAVDIIMPALIMAVYAINKIEAPESWGDVGKKIAMMAVAVIAVGGLMAVLALVIDKVQGIEPVAMLAFTAGVLVLGIAVALMVAVIGGIKQSAMNNLGKKLAVIIVAVIAIGALMYIFSEMLDSIKDIDPKAMLTFSASIILLVIALAGAAAIISVLGKVDAGTIAKGSAGLVAVGTALGAVIDVIAGFAASAIDKMTSALIDIGTSLRWFDEDVSLVNSDRVRDGMSLVKDLCELAIYVADKGDLSGNIDRYSTTMARLGAGISLFNGNAGGSAGISRAKTAISDIVEMSSELSALTTISDVSSTISNIAGAIKIYINTLEGKTLEGTPDSSKIRDVFIALNEAIPDDTMVADASAFADETKASSLNSYAIGLANISTALESFAKGTETMDFKSISTAITKLQAISDLGPLIKETVTTKVDIGGFITFEKEVVKEKESLQSFATDITSLTTALTNFGTEMGNITDEGWGRIDAGIGHLQAFAKLEGSLTPLGGLVEFVIGKRDLTSFSKKIGPLGKGLKEFCDHIVGAPSLNNGEADTASDVLIKLATAASTMPRNSGIFSKFSNTNITKFADQIPSLGTGVCGYANAVRDITGLGSEKLETATKVLVAICEAASKIPANEGMITLWSNIDYDKFGDGSMTSLGKGVTNFAEAVKSAPGLSDTSLETATKVLVAICEAAALIPENSGLVTLFKGVNYSTFESDMGHMGAGLLAFARNVGGLVAQDHKLKAKDLTDGERENIQVVTSIVDSFTKLIEILSTLTDLSTDLTSASERIKKKMSEIGNDLGQAMILFLEGFFNENEASADVRRDKLDKIVSEYDTYLPAIEEFVEVLSGLSSISFINPSNIETMLTGVSTGLTSILTFDDEIPWTQKHNNILDRVVNICDALGKMRDYIGAYESKSIEKWFGDLVNAYYMYRKAILYEGWDDRRENVTNHIIKICEGLGLISDYIHDYNSKSIEQWFVDLVDGYKAFADGINNIYADESGQFAWTEGTQTAFDRIKEMVNIIQTLDGIESPTISPVMDFNTVEQQLMQWGNKPLPGISTMLNGDISLKLDASQLEAITPKDYTVYFDSITTKMNEMNKDIVNLGSEIRRMKVVMDTGAVVGAIGDGVDYHIGKNAFFESRLKG